MLSWGDEQEVREEARERLVREPARRVGLSASLSFTSWDKAEVREVRAPAVSEPRRAVVCEGDQVEAELVELTLTELMM